MSLAEKVVDKFKELFGGNPLVVKSPGRVNLIGEHTDYNLGYVLPAAIDKAIYFAVSPRDDKKASLYSYDMNDSFEFTYDDLYRQKSAKHWPNYLMGVVDQMIKNGHDIGGFNCVFGGDIPIGAGLSSSAALEAGLAFTLNNIYDLKIDDLSMVKMSQKAENEFVGVNCGIMDQYINIFGKYKNVLRLDCRSLESEYFPFDYDNISLVLFDTRVSHSLAGSEYNQRRRECQSGTEIIGREHNEVKSLRDVDLNLLSSFSTKLDPLIYRRCRYVVEENERLLNACEALSRHDLMTFGSMMYRTHEGLSKDYEVSCPELDFLVELTKDTPSVYGSRMMGGGFGGCTINIILNDDIEQVSKKVTEEYKKAFKIEPNIYITTINNGTDILR